jgi:serine/threonine protein phosphatase 1
MASAAPKSPSFASKNERFAVLRKAKRVWAVSAIHGTPDKLVRLHEALAERWATGDRLVYLGNWLGRGPGIAATIEEMLRLRREIIALPGFFAADIVYLRGMQEEMLQKCLQLHFAVNPAEVLRWMLDQGLAATLEAYGADIRAGLVAAREGATALARWTGLVRRGLDAKPGHRELSLALRRAATDDTGKRLFVSAGLDFERPLEAQGDALWWGGRGFDKRTLPFETYARIVRGYAPSHPGMATGEFTLTLDGGCGFGGPLLAASIGQNGEILETIEA